MQRDDRTKRSEFPEDPLPEWDPQWDPEITSPAYPSGFYVVLSLLALAVPLGVIAAYTAGRGSAAYVVFRWEVPLRLMLQWSVPLVLLGTAAPVAIYGLVRHRTWSRHWIPGMVLLATIVAYGLFDSNDPMDVVAAVTLSVAAPVFVFWYFYVNQRVAGYYRARSQPIPPPLPSSVAAARVLRADVRLLAWIGVVVGTWNCLGGLAAGMARYRASDASWPSHLVVPTVMFPWAAVMGAWAVFSVALLGGREGGRKGTILSLGAISVAGAAWVVHGLRAVPLEGDPDPKLLMAAVLGGAILFVLVNLPLFGAIRLLTDDAVREALLYGPDDAGDAGATGPSGPTQQ